MLQQTFAVFLVLGLLLAALWLLRRQGRTGLGLISNQTWLGRNTGTRRLRVVERLVLTPQHSVHLISIESRLMLVTTSPSGCHLVETILGTEADPSFQNGAAC